MADERAQDDAPKPEGGEGEGLLESHANVRSDVQLLERWGVPARLRQAIANKAIKLALETTSSRNYVALARLIASLDRINLEFRRDHREARRESAEVDNAHEKAMRIMAELRAMKATMAPDGNDDHCKTD
ncbi:MAG: hypothetical protein JW809_19365 [Pirellulales bacterium]|nr:hypothetical protein [Pirellulales bacterium]